jgi:hypothetical protein
MLLRRFAGHSVYVFFRTLEGKECSAPLRFVASEPCGASFSLQRRLQPTFFIFVPFVARTAHDNNIAG